MSHHLHIRVATVEDCALLAVLIRELAVYEKLEHEVHVGASILETHMFGETPRAHAVIAELSGEVVGFALYFFNFSTFIGKPGLYIEDLFVREPHRGKGIGKRLFVHLCKLAKQLDCGRMEWWALDWNTPAIDFYKAMGAEAMSEWTVYRLDSGKLAAIAEARAPS